jgi:hypothetical protein
MRITSAIVLALILGVFQASLVSSNEISGYILTSETSLSNKDSVVYHDKNVKDLILHNLGVFDNEEISTSSHSLISKLGSKDLMTFEKLNYVFLLEGASSSAVLSTENKKSRFNHESSLFSLCSQEDAEKCILKQLFSTENKNSVLNTLKKITGNAKPEAFLFSNDEQVAADFSESRLISFSTEKGDVVIVDPSADQQFKVASSLESCVNGLFKGHYLVDLQEGVVKQADDQTPVIVFESGKEDFSEFLGDLCSVVGVSTLIRRDANPSLFVFHISSLAKLEKFVSKEQSAILYEMFNIAYNKFVKNVLAYYSSNEVSGQVFVLKPNNNILARSNFAQGSVKLPEQLFQKSRILEETTTGVKATSDSTTKLIFCSMFIVFIIVIAWVCFEMFNMDIQKDSVVYAKFLAADYFRR